MWDTIITILAPIATLLIIVVGGFLVKFLEKKAKEAQSSADKNMGMFIISFLTSSAATVVAELNQTMVEEIKKGSEDGKLTAEQASNIKDVAISKLASLIPSTLWNNMTNLFGSEDLDEILGTYIESAVADTKKDTLEFATIKEAPKTNNISILPL